MSNLSFAEKPESFVFTTQNAQGIGPRPHGGVKTQDGGGITRSDSTKRMFLTLHYTTLTNITTF